MEDIIADLRKARGRARSALAQSSPYGKAGSNQRKVGLFDRAIAEIERLRRPAPASEAVVALAETLVDTVEDGAFDMKQAASLGFELPWHERRGIMQARLRLVELTASAMARMEAE